MTSNLTTDSVLAPLTADDAGLVLNDDGLRRLQTLRDDFTKFMLQYKFAIDEVLTKVNILRDEYAHLHNENPIEHIKSRLKSPESVLDKVERKGCEPTFESISTTITDIAGIRITCSFVSDIYRVFDALTSQDDLTILSVKDYIKDPKPNGYRSLHAIVSIPIFLSSGTVPVTVELQIRTIAMDFWASLEHKIFYKYGREVPEHITQQLMQSAQVACELDSTMEDLHRQVRALDPLASSPSAPASRVVESSAGMVPPLELISRLLALHHDFNENRDSD